MKSGNLIIETINCRSEDWDKIVDCIERLGYELVCIKGHSEEGQFAKSKYVVVQK